jgi:outer membrane protein assembly factor BamB
VGLRAGVLALLATALLLGSSLHAGAAVAAGPAQVQFLFDLGDGTYAWSSAAIPDPTASNASWIATLSAASAAGLNVTWAWSSSFGVYILDVGHRSPPGGVGLYLWNGTTDAWDALLVGISTLVLRDGDAVAVSDNGFDPVTYATLYPVPTPADPYPVLEFRGDAANSGRSPSTAPDQFRVLWNRDLHLQEVPASPAVGYGRVYVLTLDGLFALDLTSGTLLWSNTSLRGLSTPALFDGDLLFGGSDGRLHAVDAATGTEAWNVTLIANPLFSGVTSSPKVLFDTAYVGTFNESGGVGEVVALWATNGTIQWRAPAPASVSFSSPAIVNGTVYVGVIGKYNTTTQVTYDPPYGVLALDASSGAQRWFFSTNGSVAASPLAVGSEIVVPAKDGFVYALNTTTGSLLWKVAAGAGVSSPALAGDALVLAGGSFGSGGRATALDTRTGSVLWTFAPNGPVQSSVASADGKVFFSTNVANGTVYALNATSGRLDWSYTPSPAQFIFGSPVVADGLVIAPSDNGHLYAFASASPDLRAVVNVTAPSSLDVGQTGNLSVRVSAPNGTWDHADLRVTVPDGLDVVSLSATASRINRTFFVDVGPVIFGQSRWFNVTVRGNASGSVPVVVFANLIAQGIPWGYSPAIRTILVPFSPTASPFPWLLVVLIAVPVAVVVGVMVWYQRRRSHGP